MIYPQPKHKALRLKGSALRNLYLDVWSRDGGHCQECGVYVELGTPPHHKVFKSQGGDDTLDNLITLCNECHYRVHHIDGRFVRDVYFKADVSCRGSSEGGR